VTRSAEHGLVEGRKHHRPPRPTSTSDPSPPYYTCLTLPILLQNSPQPIPLLSTPHNPRILLLSHNTTDLPPHLDRYPPHLPIASSPHSQNRKLTPALPDAVTSYSIINTPPPPPNLHPYHPSLHHYAPCLTSLVTPIPFLQSLPLSNFHLQYQPLPPMITFTL